MGKHQNIQVWEFITAKFSAGIPVILLYVLHSEGSSPGRQGFKMAVSGDGDFMGTIGGGIMEYKFVETAKSFLHSSNAEQKVYRQVHDKDSGNDQSGMICSGEQTIFLYRVKTGDLTAIHALVDAEKRSENGTLELSNDGIRFSAQIPAQHFEFTLAGENFILKEKTGFKNTLHIIGGGHCALALSMLMSGMDFYINVYDERPELNTMMQNEYAHQQVIVGSYKEVGPVIESSSDSYVVIMTLGYRTDDIALRALLDKDFKYIGVLGSSKKMEKMFDTYRVENINEERLAKIHAPIGIHIHSRTAAEIAVSIAAEMINVKNG